MLYTGTTDPVPLINRNCRSMRSMSPLARGIDQEKLTEMAYPHWFSALEKKTFGCPIFFHLFFYTYFAKSWLISLNALNSKALPQGSKKNNVACSPASPLNLI